MTFEEWWKARAQTLFRTDRKLVIRAAWQAATERAAGIAEGEMDRVPVSTLPDIQIRIRVHNEACDQIAQRIRGEDD